jgi:hypothetical protein
MGTKTFTTMVSLENFIQGACTKAVEKTCIRLLGVLQQLIMTEYYDLFSPDEYRRTFQFFESATIQMLNNMTGEIFMDETAMNYGQYWDGQTQLYMANSGFHGSTYYFEDGHFWDAFVEYCNKNAMKVLKEELLVQGLKLSK